MSKTKWLLAFAVGVLMAGPGHAQKLNGAGATFPYPIYSKWFAEYSASHPGVQINYQSIGSGGGIKQVTSATVDFGASDGPMTDEQLKASKVKIVHIPTVLGAVVPVFNVEGVSDLRIGPDVLADIRRRVIALAAEHGGAVTLAQLRDELGTSRKFAQALLEHFDSERLTIRRGDEHVLRRRAG